MLLRRALPATRQSFAHPFSIYEIGSDPAKLRFPHPAPIFLYLFLFLF